jgi:hypothetical protein
VTSYVALLCLIPFASFVILVIFVGTITVNSYPITSNAISLIDHCLLLCALKQLKQSLIARRLLVNADAVEWGHILCRIGTAHVFIPHEGTAAATHYWWSIICTQTKLYKYLWCCEGWMEPPLYLLAKKRGWPSCMLLTTYQSNHCHGNAVLRSLIIYLSNIIRRTIPVTIEWSRGIKPSDIHIWTFITSARHLSPVADIN